MNFSHNSHSFGFTKEELKFIGEILQDCYDDMTAYEQRKAQTVLDMIELMLEFNPTEPGRKVVKAKQKRIVDIAPPDWAVIDLSRLCKICRQFHEKSEPCK